MSDEINQKINEHSSINAILSSDNFPNLDINIQEKIIDNVYADKQIEGGIIGKLLGINTYNVAMHITFIICALLVLMILADIIHSYCVGKSINLDLIELIIPVVTLSLGYIFGKGSNQ